MASVLMAGAAIFVDIRRCVEQTGEQLEGNLFHTASWQLEPAMEAKRLNLFALARDLHSPPPVKDELHSGAPVEGPLILEVGFNAGHSACLLLLANPRARVVAFDLCEHAYTEPCADVIRQHLGSERLELVKGDSAQALAMYRKLHPDARFDLFHVDGGHQFRVAAADLEGCWRMARQPPFPRSTIVLDDTDIVGVHAAWEDLLAAGRAIELDAPFELGRFRHSVGEFIAAPRGRGADDGAACSHCGVPSAPFACGGCGGPRYCGEAHGRLHWRIHRAVCGGRSRPLPYLADAASVLRPCDSLKASPNDGLLRLFARRSLPAGCVLFSEVPLSWQPAASSRLAVCCGCGRGCAGECKPCGGCGHSVLCACCLDGGEKCRMCPELRISRGRVGPEFLLCLDLLRRWHSGALPATHFVRPPAGCGGGADPRHGEVAASVQKVGHWCSAVRWSDEQAAEMVAAMEPGRVELVSQGALVGIGYFSQLAALRVASRASVGAAPAGAVAVAVAPSDAHAFTLAVSAVRDLQQGAEVRL